MTERHAIDAAVEQAISAGATPGAALVVGRGGDILFEGYYGRLSRDGAPVSEASVYDLSSLTKPLATLATLLRLIDGGKVALDTRVGDVLGEFRDVGADPRRARVSILELAAHASGLPARGRYFERIREEEQSIGKNVVGTARGREMAHALAAREDLVAEPGSTVEYSDVGYILLGCAITRLTDAGLDEAVRKHVFEPLAVDDMDFIDVRSRTFGGRALDLARVAPTDVCPWRGGLVHGDVQDENAYAMGGIAGHAGLFGTARAVHRVAAEYVAAYHGKASFLDPALVRRCWAGPGCVVASSTWAIGWDTPTPGASSAGPHVSSRAFGHLGFTGTSLWVDLDRGVHVVLLTNRVHPSKENLLIREMRPRVHDAIFGVWGVEAR